MGKVQTLPINLATKTYMGNDYGYTGASDKSFILENCYINREGVIVKRPGLDRVIFTNEALKDKCTMLYRWDRNGTAYPLLIAAVGGRLLTYNPTTGTKAEAMASYTSTMTRNYATLANVISSGTAYSCLFVTNNKSAPIYTFPGTPSFAAISDTDCPAGTSGAPLESSLGFLDGYLLASAHGPATTSRFSWSNIPNAATTWEAISSADVMGSPDGLLRMLVIDRQIWFFGQQSIEIWEDDGVTPFSRISGGFLDRGVVSGNAITVSNGTVYLVDDRYNFGKIEGGGFKGIPLPSRIAQYWYADTIFLSTIKVDQRDMIAFQTGSGATYIYDIDLDTWYNWTLLTPANQQLSMYITDACFIQSQFIGLSDSDYGGCYKLSDSLYQDQLGVNGTTNKAITTYITSGHVDHGTSRPKRSHEVRWRSFRGYSGTVDTATLYYIDDNAQSWGPYTIDLGKTGDAQVVVRLPSQGIYKTRKYQISHAGNAPFTISHMEEDVEIL